MSRKITLLYLTYVQLVHIHIHIHIHIQFKTRAKTVKVNSEKHTQVYGTVLCQKALSAIFYFFTGEKKKLIISYNQLLVTLMFGKITKYSALNCPFTKLSCFLISVLKHC